MGGDGKDGVLCRGRHIGRNPEEALSWGINGARDGGCEGEGDRIYPLPANCISYASSYNDRIFLTRKVHGATVVIRGIRSGRSKRGGHSANSSTSSLRADCVQFGLGENCAPKPLRFALFGESERAKMDLKSSGGFHLTISCPSKFTFQQLPI